MTKLLRSTRSGALERAFGVVQPRTPAIPSATPLADDTPFIGRRTERAALLEALELAISGEGGVVLVAGEAGQGKSRLLRELVAGASWRGAQVSWGHGREDTQAQPLGPLREALATMLTPLRVRQLATMLDPTWLGELAALLPQLGDMLESLPPRAPLPPERQLQRLHAAIVQTLLALSRIAPQALLLEDVHWFDQATLESLEAIVPHVRTTRMLIVISGRADELPRRADIWQMLLHLDGGGLLQRIDLAGMSQGECTDLIRRALGQATVTPAFSARIYEVTGGNPFFILEMLRSLQKQGLLGRDQQGTWQIAEGADTALQHLPLPASLKQTIGARIQSLSPHHRRALATAVLGHTFTPSLWSRMNEATPDAHAAPPGLPPDDLLRRRFLIEDHEGYQFSHSLLREVVYQDRI